MKERGIGMEADKDLIFLLFFECGELIGDKRGKLKREKMKIFPPWFRRIWNAWDIRVSILISLSLQVILIFSGSIRKRTASRWVSFILWTAYLLADSIAILALGILANSSEGDDSCCNSDLLAFWAPFLLLHLGGPDTITAFALEDNELWLRHALTLIFQVVLAIYIFIGSLPKSRLIIPALLMFLAGILKYGERSWALMSASMDRLRNSMITDPDPGPNYAKFMEEYASKNAAGLPAEIIVEKEPEAQTRSLDAAEADIDEIMILSRAHDFIQTFRRLIVDLILSFHERNESQSFFLKRKPKDAFKVIEIELSFLYEILYTKSEVIHTSVGCSFRFITFSSVLSALVVFIFTKKNGYVEDDIVITYILLIGALVLESYAVGLLLFSDWTFLRMKDTRLSKMILATIYFFRPPNKPRWSNSMAQYNLITFCLKDRHPSRLKRFMDLLTMKEEWDKFWHTTRAPVEEKLKKFVFEDLKAKSIDAENSGDYKRFGGYRGGRALQDHKKLCWSIEVEFDESILLWHIATDLLYHTTEDSSEKSKLSTRDISKAISDYMLYLLIVQPFMLTAGIGQIRYGDTCAEAKYLFLSGEEVPNERKACQMLLSVETKVPPIQVKGDRSKSVLFDGCILAKQLQDLGTAEKWERMSAVWVEMLGYAASHCRGFYHARQLSVGGELLTLVWFLMAHLGIGEQYRIEAGHARAKLIVGK